MSDDKKVINIEFGVLKRQYDMYADEYKQAAIRALDSGWYILGNELEAFEKEFAEYLKIEHCVGLNSGLDALTLALRALDIKDGDEVIVPANTFIATVIAITENRAIPVFVEPDEYFNIDTEKIEKAITPKTKAIMVVHLYGQACRMSKIVDLAKSYNLYLIEDCAQSHGACYNGKKTGTFGDIGCFSFYPTKNLGAFGDAGAIVTSNTDLADKIRTIRNYGSKIKYFNELNGVNSRLDEIQAALLRTKLRHLNELTSERQSIANRYLNEIENSEIVLPKTADNSEHIYHLFVIQCSTRDKLAKYLLEKGIKTQIHYPVPPHLALCYQYLGCKKGDYPVTEKYAEEILSLPLYNGLKIDEIEYIIEAINAYR